MASLTWKETFAMLAKVSSKEMPLMQTTMMEASAPSLPLSSEETTSPLLSLGYCLAFVTVEVIVPLAIAIPAGAVKPRPSQIEAISLIMKSLQLLHCCHWACCGQQQSPTFGDPVTGALTNTLGATYLPCLVIWGRPLGHPLNFLTGWVGIILLNIE